MKAIVCTRSGPPEVLQLQEVPKPTPLPGEVLVRVYAGTVTPGDVMLRKVNPFLLLLLRLFGIKGKKIPGHEFAGEIEAVGKDVTKFKQGDQVFGTTTGLSTGANAEYVCVPELGGKGVLARKAANLSYEQAAAIPVGGMTALYLLDGKVHSGDKVLVYGASGSVGTYAVQLAAYFGGQVTGVTSTKNVELVKSLGASAVIDYTKGELDASGPKYDVIFDAVGKIPAQVKEKMLKENGNFVTIKSSTREKTSNLQLLCELAEGGHLKPVIDRSFPLEQTAEAHRYVEAGHKRGNVVITVAHSQE